jgi:hypothetical protein
MDRNSRNEGHSKESIDSGLLPADLVSPEGHVSVRAAKPAKVKF